MNQNSEILNNDDVISVIQTSDEGRFAAGDTFKTSTATC